MSSHAQVFFVITILLCMRHIIQCYKAYNFPKLWVESITKIYPCFLKTIRIYERINHKNVLFSLWRITTKSVYLFVIFILIIITCHVLGSNLNFWSFFFFCIWNVLWYTEIIGNILYLMPKTLKNFMLVLFHTQVVLIAWLLKNPFKIMQH